jgi:MFS family permease
MTKQIIVRYYTLTVFQSISIGFVLSTYVTFLTSRGLNLLEVNMVNFFFFTTLFIMEIPTGAFADVFGRKKSVILSDVLLGLGTLIYAQSNTFFDFAIAEIVSAFGATFATGAFQAWVVDSMKHRGFEGNFGKIFSTSAKIRTLACVVGAVIGSYAADYNDRLPWIVSGVSHGLTAILAIFLMKEEYFTPVKFSFSNGWNSIKETVRTSFAYARHNKVVRFVLVIGIINICSVQPINMYWQPYFKEYLGSQKALGILWAAMMFGVFLGQHYAMLLFKLIKNEKRCLVVCQVAAGLGMIITVLVPFPIGLVTFFLHEIPRGMCWPIKDMFLHDNIPSKERATITSFESISPHVGGMIGLLGSGIVANQFGIMPTWIVSGVILIVGTLVVSKNGSHK